MSDSNTHRKTFKYRLYPTPSQERQLLQVLNVARSWYNMCLAERKWAWELDRRSVSKSEQERVAIHYRRTFPQAQYVFSQTMQSVCNDLDKAFQAFFRRVKSGEKPGYPRFKGINQFHSFAFKQFGVGARLDGRRLKLYGVGRIAVRWHRPLAGTIKMVRIVHKAGCWYACFVCEVSKTDPLPSSGRAVGIDMGISALATLSNGVKFENPAYYRTVQKHLRRLQRKLTRSQRGSNNHRKALLAVQRQQEHVTNRRRDYLHKLSTELVRSYDAFALEDLSVSNMVRNRYLSKGVLDSGWSILRQYLMYKAENAGREIVVVAPAYTSKCCSACGTEFLDFDLSTRWVTCACGLSLDRDHNAAINILKRSRLDETARRKTVPLPLSFEDSGKRISASEATWLKPL